MSDSLILYKDSLEICLVCTFLSCLILKARINGSNSNNFQDVEESLS